MNNRIVKLVGGYRLPNPLKSDADAARLRGDDLRTMTADELLAERFRVQRAYAVAKGSSYWVCVLTPAAFMMADDWLLDRLQRIQAEIGLRKRGAA